jgi:hypothetical protein
MRLMLARRKRSDPFGRGTTQGDRRRHRSGESSPGSPDMELRAVSTTRRETAYAIGVLVFDDAAQLPEAMLE